MANLDLGLVGNCQIGVLVDARARMVWGCFPRFDGDPAFCSLLGGEDGVESHGFFDISLDNLAETRQRYLPNTAILETTLSDGNGGQVRVTDFAPRYYQYGRIFRPIMLIRNVERVAGSPTIRIRLRPAAGFGARPARVANGSNHIRFLTDDFNLRLTTNASISAIVEERAIVLDSPLSLIFGTDETIPEAPSKLGTDMLAETRRYWEGWVRGLSIPFEWQSYVIRAAITLKMCAYEDTGAVIAAMTTSVPEAPNSGRNWDYRYCWLRDSYYVVQALNRLGATKTMEDYLRYIVNVVAETTESEPLQPVYGISGTKALIESTVDHLPGYRGMGPVRVGNQAYSQIQNDSYGAVVLAATRYFFDQRLARRGGEQEFRRLERLGRQAIASADQPDAGLWEYRGRQQVHTYSSVMCWAACDRLARIAGHLGLQEEHEQWAEASRNIKQKVLTTAWDDNQNALVDSASSTNLDASLLTLADIGFLSPDDPRFLGTIDAVGQSLKRGPYLFRYNQADDFGTPETAFNICTFWYIGALAAAGRQEEARELFENMLARLNPLGLLSEDLDPETGELWGNFPQTYSMVGIINAAATLSRPWEDGL